VICRAVAANSTAISENDARFLTYVIQVRETMLTSNIISITPMLFIAGRLHQSADSKSLGFGLYEKYTGEVDEKIFPG
jgi:hypothetical protein